MYKYLVILVVLILLTVLVKSVYGIYVSVSNQQLVISHPIYKYVGTKAQPIQLENV